MSSDETHQREGPQSQENKVELKRNVRAAQKGLCYHILKRSKNNMPEGPPVMNALGVWRTLRDEVWICVL